MSTLTALILGILNYFVKFEIIKKIMLIKLDIIERYKIHKVLIEASANNLINKFILKIINKTNEIVDNEIVDKIFRGQARKYFINHLIINDL